METLIKDLNALLANLNVFYRKLQNYHWYISGDNFFTIHSKLEEYYKEINNQIDEIAEHILMLNEKPLGSMKDYLEYTCIDEAKNEFIKEKDVFQNIIEGYETLLKDATRIKNQADKTENFLTSSLMDGYMTHYAKNLWMLNQIRK